MRSIDNVELSIHIKPALKSQILKEEFWKKVTKLIEILEPITSANIELEGDGILIHKVFGIFKDFETKLREALSRSSFRPKEKKDLLAKFKERKEASVRAIHLAAAFVSPVTRGQDLSTTEQIDAMEFINNVAASMALDESKLLMEMANYKNKEDVYGKDFVWNAVDDMCPLMWWKTFYTNSVLSKVAVRILSAPISSAATERSNSTFSWIHNIKRNRLTTPRAGKITYIAHNWKLLNKRNVTKTSKSKPKQVSSSEDVQMDSDVESESELESESESAGSCLSSESESESSQN